MGDVDLTGRHILLVEDDCLLAETLGELLKSWGATVLGPKSTTAQALEFLAQADRVDFAVVDLNLHGARSFAVADALMARGIPFAFTTGYRQSPIPEPYRHAVVLRKPFGKAELEKALSL
jgi:CheY-like chemotaxis protein